MPRTRSPYPLEFREQIVALARAGRNVEELAREFEPCAHTIHTWVRQAERDGGGRSDGLTSEEREELRRLRREVRQLRQERGILSRAAAWFARESGATRSRSSDSRPRYLSRVPDQDDVPALRRIPGPASPPGSVERPAGTPGPMRILPPESERFTGRPAGPAAPRASTPS
jgi:transposase